jgi:hypothetical protein
MIRVLENNVSGEVIVDSRETLLWRSSCLPTRYRGHGNAAYDYDERSRKQREMHASIRLRLFAIGHP